MNDNRVRPKGPALPVWGDRVALERVARDLSQAELGAAVGARLGRGPVSRNTIARIEAGSRRVTDELRVAIADVFGIPPETLFPYPRLAPVGRKRPAAPRTARTRSDDHERTAAAVA